MLARATMPAFDNSPDAYTGFLFLQSVSTRQLFDILPNDLSYYPAGLLHF